MKYIFYFAATALLLLGTTTNTQAQGYIMLKSGDKQITITERQIEKFLDEMEERISDFAESIDANHIEFTFGDNTFAEAKITRNDGALSNGKGSDRFRGSSRIITEERQVSSNYRGVVASRAVKVTLNDRAGSTAIIRANDNLMPYISIKENDGVLHITIDDEIRTINNVTAEVSLPKSARISELKATSAAKIHVEHNIEASELDIEASSAADIRIAKADVSECDIELSSAASVVASVKATECSIKAASTAKVKANLLVNECYADASSAATITLSGEAGTLNVQASSAANIKATEIKALVKTNADSSSGANIKVNAGKALSANASSGGTVGYKSEHDVDIHIKKSSGGSVYKL
jgi:hypothetical protein